MDPKDIILTQEQLTAIFSAIYDRDMAELRRQNEELKAKNGRVSQEGCGS